MERDTRAPIASFVVAEESFAPGASVTLGDEVVHHLRVRRLGIGTRLALLDGHGHRAVGTLVRVQPQAIAEIESVAVEPLAAPVHLLVPIADRDRMLWLAEKCGELALTSWRPVLYRRSKSVKPRGEGPTFAAKVRAKMAGALEQSEGLWMPTLFPESTLPRVIESLPSPSQRYVLDVEGVPFAPPTESPVCLAVGPEGGLERDELSQLEAAGFQRVRLGGGILRFETAAVAAVAIARTGLLGGANG